MNKQPRTTAFFKEDQMHEHRIYKHIGAPFRVFGLTLDELGCGLAGFGGAMYSMGSLSLQISFLTVGAGGIWGLKKT